MSKHHSFIDTVYQIACDATKKGIAHLYTEDASLSNNLITINKQKVVNFSSCSYLGLELDERLKAGAIKAIKEYGTQFSASRAYLSARHYAELECKLEELFGSPVVVAPTTTLGHISAIPVIVSDDDAIILDHQVHHSVQIAVNLVKHRGVRVEMIRHNRMDMLEDRVKKLREKHQRIWYMADGVYSMYGDFSPVNEVYELMEKYPEMHYYVDDAHGMSWTGKHGKGYALSQKPIHEKMVMATSFAKAFPTGGGALVFPNKQLAQRVLNCGGPMITSGPMQPGSLGAAIASANIHLSDEIYEMQQDLQENIKYTNLLLKKYELPNISPSDSPVFFIGVSLPKMGYNLIKRLMNEGYYTNIGIFPAVPMKNTGVRFTITRKHTFNQIEGMIEAMAYHFPKVLEEENFTEAKIYQAFKLPLPEEQKAETAVTALVNQSGMKLRHEKSIIYLHRKEWDALLGDRGTFDWNGMKFLEDSFTGNELPEENWEFDYIIIRDLTGKPVLATFLTTTLAKDDMLAPATISMQVEKMRQNSRYYLCSKTLCMGSLLTEGNHLYLDRSSPLWKDAMRLLFEKIAALQEEYGASVTNLRDFDPKDEDMDALLVDNGYFKVTMPENHLVENLDWNSKEEFIKKLSFNSRRHIKKRITRHEDKYEVEVIGQPANEVLNYLYQLYLNVKENSLELNTFTLPYKVFENIAKNPNWEMLVLKLKPEHDTRAIRKPVGFVFAYVGQDTYNPMLVGLDYQFNREYNCYRQCIYRVIMRAKELGLKKVRLGYSATIEKRKFGAKIIESAAYMQAKDNYSMEVLGTMNVLEHHQ
ncbi:aminotransferase class I/II-fold pyridoxal phosphate-dependent enzyme [Bacteroidales bacterium AH-315-I05]|nr:aminotransferase class I/II-fold pyridoxal phosphate-dependent enzyme [Bacteroidales bacterium AH-315-I05]